MIRNTRTRDRAPAHEALGAILAGILALILALTSGGGPPAAHAVAPAADDTDRMNSLFASARSGETVRLSGSYVTNGIVVLPRATDVTVDARGAEFRGRTVFLSAMNSHLTWRGGTFINNGGNAGRILFNLHRSNDSTYTDMKFSRANSLSNHVFDINASSGVSIDHVTFTGYGNTADLRRFTAHNTYAEAVQVSSATRVGVGNEEVIDRTLLLGGRFDGAQSQNIRVTNSVFRPAYGANGQIIAWAQSPIGEHAHNPTGGGISDVLFQNNTVIDPVPTNSLTTDQWAGAIHFPTVSNLQIVGNRFIGSKAGARNTWISVDQRHYRPGFIAPVSVPRVTVHGNTFQGPRPRAGYVAFRSSGPTHGDPRFEIQVTGNRMLPERIAPQSR